MRAFLLPALTLFAVPFAFVRPGDVQAGYCTREVVSYTVFLLPAVQQRLQAAGFPITPTTVPYKHLIGRAWTCAYPDGGSDFFPPRVALAASIFRKDLVTVTSPTCSDATVCPAQDDGTDDGGDNTDPLIDDDANFGCACAASAACKLADGTTAAPLGVTLLPGKYTPSVACRPKACGELWLTRADGGRIDSFPPACPTP